MRESAGNAGTDETNQRNETMKTKTRVTDPHDLASELGIQYSGDRSVEYGGVFYETENWERYGYATAVRITDLDSACGFVGGVLIERISINRPDDMSGALECCGQDADTTDPRIQIEACMLYGHTDPHDDFCTPYGEIVTTDPESWEHDGWRASKYVSTDDLLGYLNANVLNSDF